MVIGILRRIPMGNTSEISGGIFPEIVTVIPSTIYAGILPQISTGFPPGILSMISLGIPFTNIFSRHPYYDVSRNFSWNSFRSSCWDSFSWNFCKTLPEMYYVAISPIVPPGFTLWNHPGIYLWIFQRIISGILLGLLQKF